MLQGIGFAHVHIYDNTELFELEQWAYERQHVLKDPITIAHVPEHKGVQRKVHRACAERMHDAKHDYAFFIDVDEFLVILNSSKYPHPIDLLLDLAPTGGLSIETMVFGQGHRKNYQPIPVTKRFQYKTHESHRMNAITKAFVHLASFNYSATEFKSPHYPPILRPQTQMHWAPRADVKLYHYTFKSRMEQIHKYAKGSAWFTQRKGLEQAKLGLTSRSDPVPNGTRFDDRAWQILKQVAPRYAMCDAFYDPAPPYKPNLQEVQELQTTKR